MITKNHFREGLESAITSGHSLGQIVSMLREIRDAGVSRHQAQAALEALRAETIDEATEDRVLEVLDIVGGYCSEANSVWHD